VGVPLYTQTAAVFVRGLLQHEYGVDLSDIHWVQGAMNVPGSHGSPHVEPLLKPVSLEINQSKKSLSTLLEEGAIDAIAGAGVPVALGRNPEIVRLFPNFHEIEREYYTRTRIFPVMHLVVIRRDVYEKHPFVASSLYNAFCKSKEIALNKMRYFGVLSYMLPWLATDIAEINQVFADGDPWPYGVEANRSTLQALVNYLCEQSMIPNPIPLEKLFVPVHGIS
jgi:4,5-dihydroxyphthalate decarboxylase